MSLAAEPFNVVVGRTPSLPANLSGGSSGGTGRCEILSASRSITED